MTTREAEREYLRQHLMENKDRNTVVFNPNGIPEHSLTDIFGYNSGKCGVFYRAVLIDEYGRVLKIHFCSDEGYMRADLGILGGFCESLHEQLRIDYPDGYRMAFIPSDDPRGMELMMSLSDEERA